MKPPSTVMTSAVTTSLRPDAGKRAVATRNYHKRPIRRNRIFSLTPYACVLSLIHAFPLTRGPTFPMVSHVLK
ncbi:MAG: hypothetical protein B5M55_02060 [Desulfococcus sp. 4484_242]|nr:MAG: hypothetical protein B5M55_02060 [Desulfococcus sp. 4484_242]